MEQEMSNSPPAFMAILLRIVLPKNDCRRIVGELEAEYHEMMPDQNRGLRGTLWYWREGISLLFAYSTSRLKRENPRDISVVLDARRYRRQTRQQARGNDERGSFMESMSLNIRYALRSLLRDPRYLLTAVLTLALGIGANTAIFTVLNGVVLKPLDYEQPGQLVRMNNNYIGSPDYLEFLTGLDFIDVRDQSESFEYLAAFYEYRQWGLDLTGGDRPRRVLAMPVRSDYFSVLSCEPLLGRNFTREEERYDNLNIIISHKLWQQHFEGDPDAIGETIMLDRELMTVVGVLPSDFREPFGRTVDVWMAHNLVPGPSSPGSRFSNNSRDNYYLSAIGRLQPGVSIEMARAELAVITSNIDREYPDRDPWQFSLIPLNEAVIGGSGKMLYILLAWLSKPYPQQFLPNLENTLYFLVSFFTSPKYLK